MVKMMIMTEGDGNENGGTNDGDRFAKFFRKTFLWCGLILILPYFIILSQYNHNHDMLSI